MANIYVRSTDGSDSDNGSTWALAKATIAGAAAIATSGDTIYVSHQHAETASANKIIAWSQVPTNVRILCVNDSAEPPTTLATSATVTTSGGNYYINCANTAGPILYFYGIQFIAGSGATGTASIYTSNSTGARTTFEKCAFRLSSSGASVVACNNVFGSGWTTFIDCTFKFGSASSYISVGYGQPLYVRGGSFESGGTTPTVVVSGSFAAQAYFYGFDFSNLSAGVDLANTSIARSIFANCKLPGSWSGTLNTDATSWAVGKEMALMNCDSTDTNYTLWTETFTGTVRHDTGVYNDAGATNGTTRLSWKMVSSADAIYPSTPLRSPEIVIWNDTTGSSKTVTVEIVHNSQGSGTNGVLNDDEIWLEVQYLGTSGVPLGSFITDCKADVLATAAAQATSSASWTGDSAGWDTQKLEVTFTPQEKGYIHAVVCLAKASTTVYVDPLLTVS